MMRLKSLGTFVDVLGMRNVNGRIIYFLLFLFFSASGCKEPDVEVSSLGKKFPAPVLKGSSPFSQNFDGDGYAVLEGACDSRVGDILISFDNSYWQKPPAAPDITGTSLTAGTTSDISCGDGTFKVYLTKNDIGNTWGFQPVPNTQVSIYIKGETVIGDTQILTLTEPKPAASKIVLEKNWPAGFAATGSCESFLVSVQDDKGHRFSSPSNISFSIEEYITGGTGTDIHGYTSMTDCNLTQNDKTSFTISQGTGQIEIYYKFPGGPIDNTVSYRVVKNSSLNADPNYLNIVLRNSATPSYQFLGIENFMPQIYKNYCYPLTVRAFQYSNHSWSGDSGLINVSVSPSTNFGIYSDSACGTASSNFPISGTPGATATIYLKYTSNSLETQNFIPITLSISGSTSSIPFMAYDFQPVTFYVDVSNDSTPVKLEIMGHNNISQGSCTPYKVITTNSNHTWVPFPTSTNVSLTTVEGVGDFHFNHYCSFSAGSGSTVTLTMPPNAVLGEIYFQPTISPAPPSGKYNFKAIASGFADLIWGWFLNP